MVGLPVLVVIAVIAYLYSRRHGTDVERARFLRRAGFGVSAVAAIFFGAFIVGDTLADPGGWQGAALIAAWALPLAGLAAIGWYRPALAAPLFGVLIAATVGLSLWFAADPHGWRSFEDDNGPIRTVITFALGAVLALFGLKRTGLAGRMLLILGVAPIVVSSFGHQGGFGSLAAASSVPVITGALYLASATIDLTNGATAASLQTTH
jgi:hypothetical protein